MVAVPIAVLSDISTIIFSRSGLISLSELLRRKMCLFFPGRALINANRVRFQLRRRRICNCILIDLVPNRG